MLAMPNLKMIMMMSVCDDGGASVVAQLFWVWRDCFGLNWQGLEWIRWALAIRLENGRGFDWFWALEFGFFW